MRLDVSNRRCDSGKSVNIECSMWRGVRDDDFCDFIDEIKIEIRIETRS